MVESKIKKGFLKPKHIGDPVVGKPWISDLTIADLDQDGLKDVIICDGKANEVRWIRQTALNVYEEQAIGDPVQGPAHVEVCDFEDDGDLDLLVASMGVIFPNNEKIGAVVIMEQTEPGIWVNHIVLDKVARVTDVRAADFNGDGLKDLAVAQFGYVQGEARWMKNLGNFEFESEILTNLSGAIHSPIADLNGDGHLDITILVSQEWEEIHLYEGDGTRFRKKVIYGSTNEDYGSSGISLYDVDRDTDLDILFTNGDAFDYARPGPRPWHGVQWLENKGRGFFEFHRLGDFPGAYSPVACDIDGDADMDILAVSGFNHWENPSAVSLICYENMGNERFLPRTLAHHPTHLIVLKAADMDDDGQIELVTGSFHAYPPFDHEFARITLWDTQ
ncbi:MAG: VCBS repeat-containing protein [Opitutales bacterium]|nr:VCBS repeat-containing protein [Opitutales bacterium]